MLAETASFMDIVKTLGTGFASSLLAFLLGWWAIHWTDFYRRASRWEPMAEKLWQERLRVYDQLLAVTSAFNDAVLMGPIEKLYPAMRDVFAVQRRLQALGGARVVVLSIPMIR